MHFMCSLCCFHERSKIPFLSYCLCALHNFATQNTHCRGLGFQDVSNNKLTDLPANISALTRLMRFNVAHNALQILPHDIGGLSSKSLTVDLFILIIFVHVGYTLYLDSESIFTHSLRQI